MEVIQESTNYKVVMLTDEYKDYHKSFDTGGGPINYGLENKENGNIEFVCMSLPQAIHTANMYDDALEQANEPEFPSGPTLTTVQ